MISLLMVPTNLYARTAGLEEAVRSLYNGTATEKSRLFIHEHINEINDMALSGDLPDHLYQSAQGDFFDRNYANLKKAAAQEGLEISMEKPNRFEPGTDTDAPLTRPKNSDIDITVEKLKKVESNYKNNIKQQYKDANVKAPVDIPDTNTDILVDPDATSDFAGCAKHVNDNGGTAYTDPDAVKAEIKISKDKPITLKEASARTAQTKKLANKKAAEARSLRNQANTLEKTNPTKAKKLRTQAQLADSQASKYIKRTTDTTNKLRKQHGLDELPFDTTNNLDKAIRNIDKNTGMGRGVQTKKDAMIVGNMQKQASEKASQKFIESLGDIAKARPHTAKNVQKAIASELNTLSPSAQGRAIEVLESKAGKTFTQSVVKEAKILKGIKIGRIVKPPTTSKKIINVLTKPRTLGPTGKKFVAVGYKTLNVTMIAGGAYFMGKDGVYHALKNVTADQTEFEFFLDVYKEAAWHGTGLGYAFEEAQAEEIAMWKREIERGEPSDSMRKHVTITIGKTVVYLGRDIVVGTLTLPYVFLEYLVGFEDAAKREKYSIAFLAEVRRQIKSKKEFQKALDTANEDGISFNDQAMYLDCMCSDCGGSLGGFFRPQFQGGGYGPCQCNGPLSIWKTPISKNPEQRAYCKESIRQMNNRITDARMDELHKIAMAENAKSVAKELKEVKELLQKEDSLDEATELFINIQPLLYPKDSQEIRRVIEPKLSEKAHLSTQKGDLNKTIKTLKKKNRVANLPDDRTYPMALAKKWQKSWKGAKETFFPQIRDFLKERKITQAENKFKILKQWMQVTGEQKESHFPPAFKDPDYLSLIKMINDKKQQRNEDIGEAWTKSKSFVSQRDPKSAVEAFEELLAKWEHTKADIAQIQKELTNRLRLFVKNAQAADNYGDKLVKKGDFTGAVDSYKKSLGIQKDDTIQKKLDDLLKKMSSTEQSQSDNKGEVTNGTIQDKPQVSNNNQKGGYWQLIEEKGSIGRECAPKERYNDYYRDTVTGFGSHVEVTKMIRKGNETYCKIEAKWQRPPEKMYYGSTLTIPVTINRLADTGQYSCDMNVSFDMWDMECGTTGGGGDIGSAKLKRKDPNTLSKDVVWKIIEPSNVNKQQKLTIRACYNAGASICGEGQGMKYYYKWISDGQDQPLTSEKKESSNSNKEKPNNTPISVKNGTDSLAISKNRFEPSEQIQLNFSASPNYPEKSWIGMFNADLPHDGMRKNSDREYAYHYLMKKTNGQFVYKAPTKEGNYDFRMFDRSSGKELATLPFSVVVNSEVADLFLAKSAFEPNEKINLEFTASSLYPEKSWIGLFNADLPHDGMRKNSDREHAFHYLMKQSDGQFTFTAPKKEGNYDFRMFERSNGKEVATIPFSVVVNSDVADLSLEKTVYEPNEKIDVEFTASTLYPEKSWIGLFNADLPHDGMRKNSDREHAFHYLMKQANGQFTFTAPKKEGNYDFRMFERSNGLEVKTIKFSVAVNEKAASLKLNKYSFAPEESITLNFTASSLYPEKSWIGLFNADLPHDGMRKNNDREIAYEYLKHLTSGQFTFKAPKKEGHYDFRMFERSSGKEVATIKFNVRK